MGAKARPRAPRPDQQPRRQGLSREGRVRLFRWLTGIYLALLMVATHWPKSQLPERQQAGGLSSDLVAHLLAYGILASLMVRSWRVGMPLARRCLWTFLLCAAIGAVDELTQPWFGREADLWDWVFNMVGASLALIGTVVFDRTRQADANRPFDNLMGR